MKSTLWPSSSTSVVLNAFSFTLLLHQDLHLDRRIHDFFSNLAPNLPLLPGDVSDALSLGCSLLLLLLVNTVVHVRIGHLLETF